MKNINRLFTQYDIVRGYYLDEIVQAYDGDITEIRYVSKYDETISVNILEDIYDKLLLDVVMMNYEEDYDIFSAVTSVNCFSSSDCSQVSITLISESVVFWV